MTILEYVGSQIQVQQRDKCWGTIYIRVLSYFMHVRLRRRRSFTVENVPLQKHTFHFFFSVTVFFLYCGFYVIVHRSIYIRRTGSRKNNTLLCICDERTVCTVQHASRIRYLQPAPVHTTHLLRHPIGYFTLLFSAPVFLITPATFLARANCCSFEVTAVADTPVHQKIDRC